LQQTVPNSQALPTDSKPSHLWLLLLRRLWSVLVVKYMLI